MLNKAKKVIKKAAFKKPAKKVPEKEPILLQPPRGMRDILPEDQPHWEHIRRTLSKLSYEYGFQRIDVPAVEYANLFNRTI